MPEPVAVFRLESGYDSTPLHGPRGQVQPGALKLSVDLGRAIRHWGLFFEAKFRYDGGWETAGDSNWYQREGSRLARAIAWELGEDFAVDLTADPELDELGDASAVRFRSDDDAECPQAAEAARALVDRG